MHKDTLFGSVTLDEVELVNNAIHHYDRAVCHAWPKRCFQLLAHALNFSAEAAQVSDLESLEFDLHIAKSGDDGLDALSKSESVPDDLSVAVVACVGEENGVMLGTASCR